MARKAQSSAGSFTGTLNNAARLYAKPHAATIEEQAHGLERSITKITRRLMQAAKNGQSHQVLVLSDLLAKQKHKRMELADRYASQEVKPIIRDRDRWEETNGQAKVHVSLKPPVKSNSTTKAKARSAIRNAGIKLIGDK